MSTAANNNTEYKNTIEAFKSFYDTALDEYDAFEIGYNLRELCRLLSRKQRKISDNKSLC